MPNYEFNCKKCKKKYEALTSYDESGKYKDVKCPHCNSKSKTKLMSACNHAFTNPVGTDRWNSDSSGHDYRFKHNIPNVQKEREMAQALSHMGTDPYGQADMLNNDIEMDTGIHDVSDDTPTQLTDFS